MLIFGSKCIKSNVGQCPNLFFNSQRWLKAYYVPGPVLGLGTDMKKVSAFEECDKGYHGKKC